MRLAIDIPDELQSSLKARAKEQSTSMRAIILRAIEKELESEGPRRHKNPTIPSTRTEKLVIDNEQIYDLIGFP